MTTERFFNVLGSLVTVAMVTTILIRGDKAAAVARAVGDSFATMTRAAIAPER